MLEAGDSSSGLVKCEKRATMCLGSLVQCVTAGDGGAFGFTGRACPDQGEFAKAPGSVECRWRKPSRGLRCG